MTWEWPGKVVISLSLWSCKLLRITVEEVFLRLSQRHFLDFMLRCVHRGPNYYLWNICAIFHTQILLCQAVRPDLTRYVAYSFDISQHLTNGNVSCVTFCIQFKKWRVKDGWWMVTWSELLPLLLQEAEMGPHSAHHFAACRIISCTQHQAGRRGLWSVSWACGPFRCWCRTPDTIILLLSLGL